MSRSVTDFIPSYPDVDDDLFSSKIFHKNEFQAVSAARASGKLPQQVFVSRYLSVHTLYRSLLVYHEPGTGKTCTAVSTIEAALDAPGSTIKNALVITKGQGLIDNFVQEIVRVCARERYADIADSGRVRSKLYPRYEFDTYEVFARKVGAKGASAYDNYVIVIDEVHNIVTESKEEYKILHEFLHAVRGCKIVLMSGTPMRDSASEIADVLNLLLPLDRQLPVGRAFDALFFRDGKLVNQALLREAARGRVSYLRSKVSDAARVFAGEKLWPGAVSAVYPVAMAGLQDAVYRKVSKNESDLYSAARQAALFVFPDGSYGAHGFAKHFRRVEKNTAGGTKSVYLITDPGLLPELRGDLARLSAKYASVLAHLSEAPDELAFVYCEYVEGSGLVVLSKILEARGYTRATGKETTPGLRYGIVTNMTTTVKNTRTLLSLFNSDRNRYGAYVRVILGSRMISEGFTLKNVRQTHILTPHWNYGETDQAIARTYRAFSHDALVADGIAPVLRIYQYVARARDGASIDAHMYQVAEEKDHKIKQVERAVKEAAVDCEIFKQQNTFPASMDMTRACEYQACAYSCGVAALPVDYSTSDLYYPDDEAARIRDEAIAAFPGRAYTIADTKARGALVVDRALSLFGPVRTAHAVGYVHIDGRTLYVSSARMEAPDSGNMFYFENPARYYTRDIASVAQKYVYKLRVPLLLTDMCRVSADIATVTALVNELPDDAKRMLLEASILVRKQGRDRALARTVGTVLAKYVHDVDGVHVSSVGGETRCLYPTEAAWRRCPPEVADRVAAAKGDVRGRAAEFGYYGIVDRARFLIKTVAAEETGDKRKAARGRVCATIDREDLDAIAEKAGIEVADTGKRDLCAKLQEWFDAQGLMVYL